MSLNDYVYAGLILALTVVAVGTGYFFGISNVSEVIVVETEYVATPCSLNCNCPKCVVCDCVAELEKRWLQADVERKYLGVER
jgi:hypothetical protein